MQANELGNLINELYRTSSDLNGKENDLRMEKVAEKFMQNFLNAYSSREISSFSKESNRYTDQLEALLEYLGIENDPDKQKIYYFAMINSIKILGNRIAVIDADILEDYSSYKYIYPILKVLYDNGTTPIGKIACELEIERHKLTNAIKRATKFQLWTQKKSGRNSLYQITYKGEQAYISFKQKKTINNEKSLNSFLNLALEEIALNMLDPQPDVNAIIRKLNSELKCTVFSSSMTKIIMQRIFDNRNIYAVKDFKKKEAFLKNTDVIKKEKEESMKKQVANWIDTKETLDHEWISIIYDEVI